MGKRLRIGAVAYLNTKPLVEGLRRYSPDVQLVYDLPSRLAEGLAAGDYDVALIPSIELFHHPDYSVVGDACIACRGPVWSVKLLSRCPLREIQTLALDEGSRTSVALVRILLETEFSLSPQLLPLPIDTDPMEVNSDALLLIGDRAMHVDSSKFSEVWDLGEKWVQWSGLPMVFATWTARHGVDRGDLESMLSEARDAGLKNLHAIARREGPPLGLTEEQAFTYLHDNLHFYLGPKERSGLELFHRHAARIGLAPEKGELKFYGCSPVG